MIANIFSMLSWHVFFFFFFFCNQKQKKDFNKEGEVLAEETE